MVKRRTAAAVIALAFATAGSPLLAHAKAGLSMSVMALAKQCAPSVAPITMGYLVAHESRNNPYAVHINGLPDSEQPNPKTYEEAKELVERLTREGASFDTGYGQVWSGNLAALGVTAVDMLDPCKNLHASGRILTDCYRIAISTNREAQTALRHSFSCYNTGNQEDGFTNGYVGKILALAQANNSLKVPALRVGSGESMDDQAGGDVAEESARPVRQVRLSGMPEGFVHAAPEGFSRPAPDGFEAIAQQQDGAPHEGFSHPAKATRGTE
ncbi:TPA: lytic transglycosylase domain-containing protein [Pseudomonas aeruginosa]|uniref:lytic transglycosylase domain-containing protein n=1 Tax=Pseudomonas aeruginosa TaxID=287 RepID=UPI000D6DE00D|nr:lytic transglycosylase domain-containing protein [Pseudomonas aeruginosa]MCV0164074.1 lytic transglycosylase domain-containing protein [Pseudomonas aeruginosa]HBN8518929.1 lytic transglycosylase domain-containing protein [Pseudomonas aeruginosa]HCF4324156.1 lytic transglycosylase domain-containing protein [Pseudomonas aeruginosa]HCF5667004.1 lytic transglycosylase domain-containing protein [Pseudomonas aeruginosa]HDQ4754588.1 lytic transglycosylase domain-containing protein [Pseudomonas aer